jgi:histone deacetylase complex regulatory component SIN3
MIIFLVLLNLFHQNIFNSNNSLGIVFSLLSFNYNLWRERKEIKKKKKISPHEPLKNTQAIYHLWRLISPTMITVSNIGIIEIVLSISLWQQ